MTKEKDKQEGQPPRVGYKIKEALLLRIATKHRLNTLQTGFLREYLKDPTRPQYKLKLAAGYTASSAETSTVSPIRNPRVQGAIEDYIRAGKFDGAITKTYTEILALNPEQYHEVSEKVAITKVKLEAVKDLNKIKGSYAPKQVEKKELHAFVGFGPENCTTSNVDAETMDGEIIPDAQLPKS